MSFTAGKLRVLIATTSGPVEIQLLTEEDAAIGRCVACIGGTTETADIATAYHAFVVRPTGVIQARFGHSCYRLDVSSQIDAGSSWQLGVLAAHALLAVGRLAQENDVADGIVWATGSVRPVDLTVGAVNHVPEKLIKSIDRLKHELNAGHPVVLAVPAANAAQAPASATKELLELGAQLVVVRHAEELFDVLGIKLPGAGSKGSASTLRAPATPQKMSAKPRRRIFAWVASGTLIGIAAAGAAVLTDLPGAKSYLSHADAIVSRLIPAPAPKLANVPAPEPVPAPTSAPAATPTPAASAPKSEALPAPAPSPTIAVAPAVAPTPSPAPLPAPTKAAQPRPVPAPTQAFAPTPTPAAPASTESGSISLPLPAPLSKSTPASTQAGTPALQTAPTQATVPTPASGSGSISLPLPATSPTPIPSPTRAAAPAPQPAPTQATVPAPASGSGSISLPLPAPSPTPIPSPTRAAAPSPLPAPTQATAPTPGPSSTSSSGSISLPLPPPASATAPTRTATATLAPTPAPVPTAPGQAGRRGAEFDPETIPFITARDRQRIRDEYLPARTYKALAMNMFESHFVSGLPSQEKADRAAVEACEDAKRQPTRQTSLTETEYRCELFASGSAIVKQLTNIAMPPMPWINASVQRPFSAAELPVASAETRETVERRYPRNSKSKALVISPRGRIFGAWGASSSEEAMRQALERCGYISKAACLVIAVDDDFVAAVPTLAKVIGLFRPEGLFGVQAEERAEVARRLAASSEGWQAVAVGARQHAGTKVGANSERSAVDGAMEDCAKRDRDCSIAVIGPFLVEAATRTQRW